MNTAEIARRAADILAEKGLSKGGNEDHNGKVCFWGAIYTAACGNAYGSLTFPFNELTPIAWMAEAILAERGMSHLHAATWNDMPATTEEDVILLLKETGYRLENQ